MDAQEDAFLRERGCLFVQIEREPFLSAQSQWFNMEDHVPAFAQKKRQQRDGDCLHLTVLTAKERKQVSRSEHRHKRDQTPATTTFFTLGYGNLRDGNRGETHFLICHYPDGDKFRRMLGLEPKDFHITLGFAPVDDHSEWKGLERAILFAPSYITAILNSPSPVPSKQLMLIEALEVLRTRQSHCSQLPAPGCWEDHLFIYSCCRSLANCGQTRLALDRIWEQLAAVEPLLAAAMLWKLMTQRSGEQGREKKVLSRVHTLVESVTTTDVTLYQQIRSTVSVSPPTASPFPPIVRKVLEEFVLRLNRLHHHRYVIPCMMTSQEEAAQLGSHFTSNPLAFLRLLALTRPKQLARLAPVPSSSGHVLELMGSGPWQSEHSMLADHLAPEIWIRLTTQPDAGSGWKGKTIKLGEQSCHLYVLPLVSSSPTKQHHSHQPVQFRQETLSLSVAEVAQGLGQLLHDAQERLECPGGENEKEGEKAKEKKEAVLRIMVESANGGSGQAMGGMLGVCLLLQAGCVDSVEEAFTLMQKGHWHSRLGDVHLQFIEDYAQELSAQTVEEERSMELVEATSQMLLGPHSSPEMQGSQQRQLMDDFLEQLSLADRTQVIFMLIGLPGCGKTVFAEHLQSTFGPEQCRIVNASWDEDENELDYDERLLILDSVNIERSERLKTLCCFPPNTHAVCACFFGLNPSECTYRIEKDQQRQHALTPAEAMQRIQKPHMMYEPGFVYIFDWECADDENDWLTAMQLPTIDLK